MKSFRSLIVLKRPRCELWSIMRDRLIDLADQLADISSVREVSRSADADGQVHIVNEWRARHDVPPAFRTMLQVNEIGWLDRNVWDAAAFTCSWRIEPLVLSDYIVCSGQTVFADAMAGRGTRVTISGELDLKPGLFSVLGVGEAAGSAFIDSIATTAIPRNLRSVAEAAAAFET